MKFLNLFRSRRAFTTMALVIFLLTAAIIVQGLAVGQLSQSSLIRSHDYVRQQILDRSILEQVVKETMYFYRELKGAPVSGYPSTPVFKTEMDMRLSVIYPQPSAADSMSLRYLSGPNDNWPLSPVFPEINTFTFPGGSQSYMSSTPPSSLPPDRFNSLPFYPTYANMQGIRRSVSQQLFSGPFWSGPAWSFSFIRHVGLLNADNFTPSAAAPQGYPDLTYTVTTKLYLVPLTNYNVVSYGLPATGLVPAGTTGQPAITNISPANSPFDVLFVPDNNPATDTADLTTYQDAYDGSSTLPYRYRESTLMAWDAYEFLMKQPTSSSDYRYVLRDTAAANSALFDFYIPATVPSNCIYNVGSKTLTVDLNLVDPTGQVLAVVDSNGGGNIVLQGSPRGPSVGPPVGCLSPIIIIIMNQSYPAPSVFPSGSNLQTNVSFSGNNYRPVIVYFFGCSLDGGSVLGSNLSFSGGCFFDRYSSMTRSADFIGHVSYYYANPPFTPLRVGYDYTVETWLATKSNSPALPAVAPRALLISASSVRN